MKTTGFFQYAFLCFATCILLTFSVNAQPENIKKTIRKEEQKELIKLLCDRLDTVYLYPENVGKIRNYLNSKFEKGAYDKYNTPGSFASFLDKELMTVTNDKHMGIVYDPKMAADMTAQKKEVYYTPKVIEEFRQSNFHFKELKILEGNVGYMDLREFCPPKYAAETAVAAMNYFSNCSALIIDLRYNGGGDGDMVDFLLSYLLDSGDTSIVLSTSYTRFSNSYFQSRISPYVPGKTIYKTPLYVLTSKSTFSAAEAFTFFLKKLKRATLVGENTRGGENPVEIQVLNKNYIVYIPSVKVIGYLSGTNEGWEGVGIKPDIETEASKALTTAHIEALKMLFGGTTDAVEKQKYQWAIDGVIAKENPVSVDISTLKSYEGSFCDYNITFFDGALFYQRGDRAKMKMIPFASDSFMVEDLDYLRIKFIRDNENTVGVKIFFNDGEIRECQKNKK